MTRKIVVAFDGSEAGQRAIEHAAAKAIEGDAQLIVAHVLEWSPYSFLSAQELAERHKRREQELTRAREAVVAPVLAELAGRGVAAEAEIRYGHVAEALAEIATEVGADSIVVGRTGGSGMAARLFGSVAVVLAQITPVPLTIVP